MEKIYYFHELYILFEHVISEKYFTLFYFSYLQRSL